MRVSLAVTLLYLLISYLGYPELEGDEARRAIWLHSPSLVQTHELRHLLNNSNVDYREVLPKFEIPIVASVLKLYLLELPGSFVFHGATLDLLTDHPARFSCFFTGLRNCQNNLLDHCSRDHGRGTDQGAAEHAWTTPSRQHCYA